MPSSPVAVNASVTEVVVAALGTAARSVTGNGAEVTVGVSIGIAPYEPDQPEPEDLLRRADAAMYRAKRNGRGRYEVFAPGMELAPAHRPADDDLRRAIDEFVQRAATAPT